MACSGLISHPAFVSTPGVHPVVLTLNSQPFPSRPASPEDNGGGSHLFKLAPSIIIPMLSAPAAAFVCMPGRSSGTNGRWARWHPQVGEPQRQTAAAQWEKGFSDWTWCCCPNYLSCAECVSFRNKCGMSVNVSLILMCFSTFFAFVSLPLFQEQIKFHLSIKLAPTCLEQNEYHVIQLKSVYL